MLQDEKLAGIEALVEAYYVTLCIYLYLFISVRDRAWFVRLYGEIIHEL